MTTGGACTQLVDWEQPLSWSLDVFGMFVKT